ncbi:MAG: tetratricopeptide repeat protein [Methanothrix sp.]
MKKNYFYVRSIVFLGLAAIVFFPVISEGVKNSNQSDNTIECCIEDADINETGTNKSVIEWNYIGNCLYNLKKYPEAIKAYDNAIMVDHNLDAWNNRGDALYYNKSYAEAEKSYNNNSTLQNNLSQKVWYGKGKSLIRQNKIVEADVLY